MGGGPLLERGFRAGGAVSTCILIVFLLDRSYTIERTVPTAVVQSSAVRPKNLCVEP